MPTILLTRPLKASRRLADELRRLGCDGVIAPMLKIAPTLLPSPTNVFGALMITSGNSLDVLDPNAAALYALLDLPCFCVGTRTAERAQDFGFRDVRDAAGDGAALAQRIRADLPQLDKPILHIGGRDIASAAEAELNAAGHVVIPWLVYAAEPASEIPSDVTRALRAQQLDAALFFSTRTAAVFRDLICRDGLEACCKSLIAVGISASVTDALASLPWRLLTASVAPTEESVLQRLQEVLLYHDRTFA